VTDSPAGSRTAERHRAFRRFVTIWALLGGALLCAVVLVNTGSIIGAALFTANETGWLGGALPHWMASPILGDFELTEMGVCIAVFSFLPYCQLTRSNVTADIFTAHASPQWVARFSLLASLVALAFMAILAWRMYFGMLDQREYGYTTAILLLKHWYAYLPILASLALTVLAALVTLAEDAERA